MSNNDLQQLARKRQGVYQLAQDFDNHNVIAPMIGTKNKVKIDNSEAYVIVDHKKTGQQ